MQNGIIDIELVYCAPCGYQDRALALVQEVIKTRDLEVHIRSFRLVPGTKGIFDVSVNGEKVFSKHELGRHAEPGECLSLIDSRIKALVGQSETPA